MNGQGESFGKVRYDLRPSKQVERLMLIDAFRRLGCAGFPIGNYKYIGMGSTHFYDYQLFHKYLGIREMVSAELDQEKADRVEFNRPFDFVEIDMRPIGALVAEASRKKKVILWLDYDDRLRSEFLKDFGLAVARLAVGSIVLLTIDIEPPRLEQRATPADYYKQRLGEHVPASWPAIKFGPAHIAKTVLELAFRAVKVALRGRAGTGVSFEPILNCTYKDGHRMLSFGGVIATEDERRRIRAAKLDEEPYYCRSLTDDPFEIRVPVLTNRERLYMDANMPASARWRPQPFSLSRADLASYKKIYRFTPVFVETIA